MNPKKTKSTKANTKQSPPPQLESRPEIQKTKSGRRGPRRKPGGNAPNPKKGPSLRVRVEGVAFGGDGIARHEGKVVFIADALPGEELLVELISDKERFARAHILERLAPAPYAQKSPCIYAERCGGCQWLTVPYAEQLEWKKAFIESALTRIAKTGLPSEGICMHGSPKQDGFRNRIKLKMHLNANGSLELGYFARGSHELVVIESCYIAAAPINQALTSLGKLRLPTPHREAWYELELQEVANGITASFIVQPGEEFPFQLRERLEKLSKSSSDSRLIWVSPDDAPRLFEVDQGLSYLTFGGQFQQVNQKGNQQLRAWILAKALALKAKRVLDLYCGSGNFSLPLLRAGVSVWGVELASKAIICAQENMRLNALEGGSYAESEVEEAKIKEQFPQLEAGSIDLLIADPPRSGMAEALAFLEKLSPAHMIYISCDPNTLARDLKHLLAMGYRIETVEGLDFFPHSFHVETVVHLAHKRTTALI